MQSCRCSDARGARCACCAPHTVAAAILVTAVCAFALSFTVLLLRLHVFVVCQAAPAVGRLAAASLGAPPCSPVPKPPFPPLTQSWQAVTLTMIDRSINHIESA
jgi:hypothetical protein